MAPAKKFDGSKARMDLVPPEAMEALAAILGPGAAKYGDRNWEQGGLTWDRLYAAMQRHMLEAHKYMSTGGRHGQWLDPELGTRHIENALACLTFIVTYVRRGMLDLPDLMPEPGEPKPSEVVEAYKRRLQDWAKTDPINPPQGDNNPNCEHRPGTIWSVPAQTGDCQTHKVYNDMALACDSCKEYYRCE